MNQANIKNKIPEEVVELIISYTHDRRGYTFDELKKYKRIKRKKFHKMKRITVEIQLFNDRYNGTIGRLKPNRGQRKRRSAFLKSLKYGKPIINYHTGLYVNINWERNWLKHVCVNLRKRGLLKTYLKVRNSCSPAEERLYNSLAGRDSVLRMQEQKRWNRMMAGAANTPL